MGHIQAHSTFFSQFSLHPQMAGFIGLEREFFLLKDGLPTPKAPDFLDAMNDPAWTYELSACQVEYRSTPTNNLATLLTELTSSWRRAKLVAKKIDAHIAVCEVAPATMTTEIYPRDERYRVLSMTLPREVLLAACRVTGTHIHIGARDLDHLLRLYNHLASHCGRFAKKGDQSNGKRLELYRVMKPDAEPPQYESLQHFAETAIRQGFYQNPRDCWHLVRMSRHGTVEIRVFGVTEDLDLLMSWVEDVVACAKQVT